MKTIANFINNFHVLPAASLKNIFDIAELKNFSKKDIITKKGKNPSNLYILKSGVVRSYYSDNKNKEYISSLFTPCSTTGALGALISNKPSVLSYDCLTDCELFAINFKSLKELIYEDKDVAIMYSNALESIFLLLEARIYNLSVLNATERYINLKNEIPGIENMIPQYHIASYLNVSAVQLSRIRKEIYSK